jgi:sulfonate transport system substrate-binding protein
MRLSKLAFLGLCAALVGASDARAQAPVKIRVSWVAPIANWASILLEKKDLARHFGTTYVMEPVRYAGTPLIITALANRELEIGNLAYSTLALAVQNAGLDDLRIIADEFQDGIEG